MKCSACGAEIAVGTKVCPFCDAVLEGEEKKQTMQQSAPADAKEPVSAVQNSVQPTVSVNPLLHKKYELESGGALYGFFSKRVNSTVEVGEDRLFISIKPKKLNVSPVIMLEDVLSIDFSLKLSVYFVIYAILCAIAACNGAGPMFLLSAFFIWASINTKITITQRNGKNVVMYSKSKADAQAFKNDMKKITKIQ